MKIAVTSSGPSAEAAMDDRLGRCPYFVIMDSQNRTVQTVRNEAADVSSGAGTKAMQKLLDLGVEVVITGHIGPNTAALLSEANVRAVTGKSGKVSDVLAEYSMQNWL